MTDDFSSDFGSDYTSGSGNDWPSDVGLSDAHIEQLLADTIDRVEPLPPRALVTAYRAIDLADVDAEVAALVYDSLLEPSPALRGDEGEARIITFANDHLSVDISLLGDGKTIVGEIEPAEAYAVELETATHDMVAVSVDDFGRFRATTGASSFRLRVVGHLVTPWVSR